MTNKEMKMKAIEHLRKMCITENVLNISEYERMNATINAYRALGFNLVPCWDSNDQWCEINEYDNNDDLIYSYQIVTTKRDLVEITLQKQLTRKQLESLKRDWKAFYNEPLRYKNLAEMVNDYLNKIEIDKSMMDDIKQGFEICK